MSPAFAKTRVEQSNRFSKAIFYANNQSFQQGEPQQMIVATACKMLIQNAIVLWNYLYFFQHLLDKNDCEKEKIINDIRHGSVMCWHHVNLQGEYDFKRPSANHSIFNMKEIMKLKVA
ncbi:MAG: Tn3 family transposase [Pseudomonadota bacterium]